MGKVILVTGGTGQSAHTRSPRPSPRTVSADTRREQGLVGRAIEYTVKHEPVGSRFGTWAEDDKWIYLSSKDGDLRSVPPFPQRDSTCPG